VDAERASGSAGRRLCWMVQIGRKFQALFMQGNRVKEFAPIRAKETGRNSHSASTWCGTITPVQARRRSVARVG
jgi:hypothetical protein